MSQPSSNQILALALLLTSLSSLILSATEADQTIDAIDPKKCGRGSQGFWPEPRADRHSLARAHHKRHNSSRYGQGDSKHPWYVALSTGLCTSDVVCGGVIIHTNLIVTSASCMAELKARGHEMWVYAGSDAKDATRQESSVKKWCSPLESARDNGRVLDIAVARLHTDFKYTQNIQPACLDKDIFTGSSNAYQDCIMVGLPLGVNMNRRVESRILFMNECDANSNIARDQLCLTSKVGSGALWSADMGGPLICKKQRDTQAFTVGVASHLIDGNRCSEYKTSRVAVSWFQKQAKALTELVELCL